MSRASGEYMLVSVYCFRNEVYWWKSLGIQVLPWTVNSESEKMFLLHDLNLPLITDDVNPDTFEKDISASN